MFLELSSLNTRVKHSISTLSCDYRELVIRRHRRLSTIERSVTEFGSSNRIIARRHASSRSTTLVDIRFDGDVIEYLVRRALRVYCSTNVDRTHADTINYNLYSSLLFYHTRNRPDKIGREEPPKFQNNCLSTLSSTTWPVLLITRSR